MLRDDIKLVQDESDGKGAITLKWYRPGFPYPRFYEYKTHNKQPYVKYDQLSHQVDFHSATKLDAKHPFLGSIGRFWDHAFNGYPKIPEKRTIPCRLFGQPPADECKK
jgi:hypothetical protein